MAQTPQIFQNRVMPQISGLNTAVFAQPIQSFKPMDLGDALAGEKLELERQKLAIAAEKNRIDMEEAKARVAILEKNVKEKRAADNKSYLDSYIKSMKVGSEDASDVEIPEELRNKIIARNNEWQQFIINSSSGDANLTPQVMYGEASKILQRQATDSDYIKLKRLDNEIKGIAVDANRATSLIDPTLFNDFKAKYVRGEITDRSQINIGALEINTKYIDSRQNDIMRAVGKQFSEEVEVQDMAGRRMKITTLRKNATPEDIALSTYGALKSDKEYERYAINRARREQILSRGLPSEITDIKATADEIMMNDAIAIGKTLAPDINWNQMTNPISKRVSIKQESQAGAVTVNANTGTPSKYIFTSKLDGKTDLAQANKEGYTVQSGSLSVRRDEELDSELNNLGYTQDNSKRIRNKMVDDVLGYSGTGELKLNVYESQDYPGLGVIKETSAGNKFIASDGVYEWGQSIENGNNGKYKFKSDESIAQAYTGAKKLVGEGGSVIVTTYKDAYGNNIPIIGKPSSMSKYINKDGKVLPSFSTAIIKGALVRGTDYIGLDASPISRKKSTSTNKSTPKSNPTPPKPNKSKIKPPTNETR